MDGVTYLDVQVRQKAVKLIEFRREFPVFFGLFFPIPL